MDNKKIRAMESESTAISSFATGGYLRRMEGYSILTSNAYSTLISAVLQEKFCNLRFLGQSGS